MYGSGKLRADAPDLLFRTLLWSTMILGVVLLVGSVYYIFAG
jgi:hypothetical protein